MARKKVDPLSVRIIIEIVVLSAVLIGLLIGIGAVWAGVDGSEGDPTGSTGSNQGGNQGGSQGGQQGGSQDTEPLDMTPEAVLQRFIENNGLTRADYPDFVLESYQKCAELYGEYFECQDFYLNYPLLKEVTHEIDISGLDRSNGVPLMLQWDERWGYLEYGVSVCGIGGCGPTSLSMVAYYLTGDSKYTPAYMMQYATENKHVIPTGGTDWSLFGTGAVELGFQVEQLPNVERTVAKRLEAGIPVVVNVGPGTFTTGGHYMVLVGYENGMFRINDPNSPEYSSRLWAWDDFQDQVRNFWAISNPK